MRIYRIIFNVRIIQYIHKYAKRFLCDPPICWQLTSVELCTPFQQLRFIIRAYGDNVPPKKKYNIPIIVPICSNIPIHPMIVTIKAIYLYPPINILIYVDG